MDGGIETAVDCCRGYGGWVSRYFVVGLHGKEVYTDFMFD